MVERKLEGKRGSLQLWVERSLARFGAGLVPPEPRTADDGVHAVEALDGASFVRAAGLFGRAVHVTAEAREDIAGAVAARLAERGVRHGAITRIEPTLEHVFIARVQASGGALEDA